MKTGFGLLAVLDLRQERRVQDLLAHERQRQAGRHRDIGRRQGLLDMHVSREVARKKELAR